MAQKQQKHKESKGKSKGQPKGQSTALGRAKGTKSTGSVGAVKLCVPKKTSIGHSPYSRSRSKNDKRLYKKYRGQGA